MSKYAAMTNALFALAMPTAWAAPPALLPTPEFNGTIESANVGVQSWTISGERSPGGPTYELPLQGFYVAHLMNGDIWTTIDGKTMRRATGDYWTVNSGATMQVKARGQGALLETIVIKKQ
jgi:hypothetical protein